MDVMKIPYIANDTNFWLVRTKKGYFYDEFVKKSFVGIGFNTINASTLSSKLSKEQEETIKLQIKKDYDDLAQPGVVLSKCMRFIHEVKENDIIMMPSNRSSYITFAQVGAYYEDETKTLEEEKDIISRIENGQDVLGSLSCPYKKRRKIKVLKTISNDELNINLYRALNSYHGISSINDYKIDVLNAIFSLYYYQDKLTVIINVKRKDQFSPKELGRILYNTNDFLENYYDEKYIFTKVNLNSPGDIIIEIGKVAYNFLVANYFPILFLIGTLTGGKFLGFEFNSIADVWVKFATANDKIESSKLDNENKELQNKKLQIEIENLKKDNPQVIRNLDEISEAAKYFDTTIDEKVIQISDYFQKPNTDDET